MTPASTSDPRAAAPDDRRRRRAAGVVLGTGLVACAALAGVGVYHALFTDTQSTSPSYGTGTVTLAGIGTNATNNRLSVGASNLAAGDTVERTVDVKYTGSIAAGSVTLTTSATTSSLLDTDTTNGLQLVIDRCSVPWSETSNAGSAPYTYTCGGVTSSVVASRPVIASSLTLNNLVLTTNTDNYLRATLTVPGAAGNTMQNLSSTIQFAFTATQRAGTSQ